MIRLPRLQDPTDIWTYQNFLNPDIHQLIEFYVNNLKNDIIDNYEGRTIAYGDKSYRLKHTAEHRNYHKLWNLSYAPEYWNQTNDTIYEWANNQYRQVMHPAMKLLIDKVLLVPPFNKDQEKWVAVRGIFNLLKPGIPLDPHLDSMVFIMDCNKYPTYSATYYIDVPGEGGEFWDERGFLFKPLNNSLLINIGSKYLHGVRASTKFRVGVTIRFIKSTDLVLPGNIDELLYKPVC
jgi:hypothetical protein